MDMYRRYKMDSPKSPILYLVNEEYFFVQNMEVLLDNEIF